MKISTARTKLISDLFYAVIRHWSARAGIVMCAMSMAIDWGSNWLRAYGLLKSRANPVTTAEMMQWQKEGSVYVLIPAIAGVVLIIFAGTREFRQYYRLGK